MNSEPDTALVFQQLQASGRDRQINRQFHYIAATARAEQTQGPWRLMKDLPAQAWGRGGGQGRFYSEDGQPER